MGFFTDLKNALKGAFHECKINITYKKTLHTAINTLDYGCHISDYFTFVISDNLKEAILLLENKEATGSLTAEDKELFNKYKNLLLVMQNHNNMIARLLNGISLNAEEFMKNPVKYKYVLDINYSYYEQRKAFRNLVGPYAKFVSDYTKCENALNDIIEFIKKYIADTKIISNSFDYINPLSPVYAKYLPDMEKYACYSELLCTYYALTPKIFQHNNEIDRLRDELNKIEVNKYNVIKSPIEYKDFDFTQYDELIKECSKYINKPQRYIDCLNDIEFLKKNYKTIVLQFEKYEKCKNIKKDIEDKYYDYYESHSLIQSGNAFIENCKDKHNFYDFDILKLTTEFFAKHNEAFVKEHSEDKTFDDIDGKNLDSSQREAVLVNPVSELTVAGAGSGKTLTICAKVKHLLENKLATPDDILLLTYSKNSSVDLQNRIEKIDKSIKVSTFHSLGLSVINVFTNQKQCIDDQGLPRSIHQYFTETMFSNSEMCKKILTYYGLFLQDCDLPIKKYNSLGECYEDLKRNDMRTLKTQLRELSDPDDKKITFKRERVKSYEELIIANYYFINGIEYEYEGRYKEKLTANANKRQYCPDFTLLDYGIYHEHYGIDEKGRAPQYPAEEENDYLFSIQWKRNMHKTLNTKCMETYSYDFKNGDIFEKIDKQLEAYGIKKRPLSDEEVKDVMNYIYNGHYFESFIKLVTTFISLYKSRYRDNAKFKEFKKHDFHSKIENLRASLFLDICESIYNFYMNNLRAEEKIDFDDMILDAKQKINNLDTFKYKYVIVDEFQDISYSRMEFLKAIIAHGNSKLYAVGDDWQAIYRFSGCDLNIFLHFEDYFEHSLVNNIANTHRNAQELQDIVEPFITKNPEQYKKHINSSIHLEYPVKLYYYDNNPLDALLSSIEAISKLNPNAKVLLLGRNNKDLDRMIEDTRSVIIEKSNKVIFKDYPNLDVEYKTVHGSKGLESEYVILINARNSKYGFPNKVEDDVLLSLVLSDKSSYPFAEERRLWYVALTRTKKYVYILVDKENPSEFIKEIKDKCEINESNVTAEEHPLYCPHCKTGKLVIRENSRTNKKFYGCTNYPYCNYTCNDIEAVEKDIRCPECGYYLERRKGRYGPYIKCTNKKCNYSRNLNTNNQL